MEYENEAAGVNVYDYLHGYCEVFAAHLHDKYGYDVESVLDADGQLVHCYGVKEKGGTTVFADVRGETDDYKELIEEFADDLYGVYSNKREKQKIRVGVPSMDAYKKDPSLFDGAREITRRYRFWR